MENEKCTTVEPSLQRNSGSTHSRAFVLLLIVVAQLCITTTACTGGLTSPSDATDGSDALQFCASEINRLRATVNRPALRQSSALEAFAATAIARDAASRTPHGHFHATNGGGVSRAETEILWWRGYSVRRVIELGLAQMWSAGPGSEHYDILTGAYSEVGCGIFVNGDEVSVAQEFR